MEETQSVPGYEGFITLFQNGILILRNEMRVSIHTLQFIEHVTDSALTHPLAALPGEQAVEMIHLDTVMQQPSVQILTDDGSGDILIHPFQLRLVPFNEIVERMRSHIDVFKLFLSSINVPSSALLRNVSAWRNVDARLINEYWTWLGTKEEGIIKTALDAIDLYCRLAVMDGYISDHEYDEIVAIIQKPRVQTKKRHVKGTK